jgi:molybdopterin-guanine dinucleotide biosynthesis protein A
VLGLLVERLAADDTRQAAVLDARGRRVPLPLALRTRAGTDAARQLVGDGERRLRAILDRLATLTLAEGEWRPLDPAAETLRDVDVPGDLADRRPGER